MKYTLLQNGNIISGKQLIKGDLLIGNSRIMAIEETIHHHSFEAEVIDLKGKFVLPGLLHYNCPFIATEDTEEAPGTTIYQAISHGATFIMDTLSFNKESNCIEQLLHTREGCKPIISDFGFHMGMNNSCEVSAYDIDYCFVHEGITSFFLPGNFRETLPESKMDKLFECGARHKTIFICDTRPLKASSTSMQAYLMALKELLDLFTRYGCMVLFLDVNYRSVLRLMDPYLNAGSGVHLALNLSLETPHAGEKNEDLLGIDDLLAYKNNMHVMLSPPWLGEAKDLPSSFIEHGRNVSFIERIYHLLDPQAESLLPTLCEFYAARPARLLGIYPRKGILKAGSDADLIIWSPSSTKPKDAETSGTANTALLRKDIKKLFISGVLLENNDALIQEKMSGRFIHRSTPLL